MGSEPDLLPNTRHRRRPVGFPYANELSLFSADGQGRIDVLDCTHPGRFGLQIDSLAESATEDLEPELTAVDGIKALKVILDAYDVLERI